MKPRRRKYDATKMTGTVRIVTGTREEIARQLVIVNRWLNTPLPATTAKKVQP